MGIHEFMEELPSFIQQAKDIGMNTDGKIVLTTSLDSVKELDRVLEYIQNLWRKKLINDTVAWNTSVVLGALLGEMIINERGFHWAMNDNDLPVVETDDHNQLSPISKLYKIITDEDDCEGTASGFYEGFKALEHYQSLSDEEKERITTYVNKE